MSVFLRVAILMRNMNGVISKARCMEPSDLRAYFGGEKAGNACDGQSLTCGKIVIFPHFSEAAEEHQLLSCLQL
jgi:hypothetical protein